MRFAEEDGTSRSERLLVKEEVRNGQLFLRVALAIVLTLLLVWFGWMAHEAARCTASACLTDACCARGFSCKRSGGRRAGVCLPDCISEVWGACEDDSCCPENSGCSRRSNGFSQCVPFFQ